MESSSRQKYRENDIAVIGMSCRLPGGSDDPRQFYEFLLSGEDGIVSVPNDRWDSTAYFDPDKDKSGRMYVNQGGFIKNIDQFDPQFFGISPIESPNIDPQHRWLLELSYEAFENAGINISAYKGSDTAVYIGQFMHDYEQIQLNSAAHKLMSNHSATGSSMTLTANRISYTFDFTGSSVSLDTACSSSLVALDLACKAILAGDSSMALAGGVNILLRPELTMSICKASMLSPDCRCKSFDASANGYVRSEGAGVVLLKKASEAIKDGNNIVAILKATGSNQDGQTIGITVPNGESQKKLLLRSLSNAGLKKEDIQYAEAHGTGTAVGDPIEVNALGEILGDRPRCENGSACIVGSVKSNIGHSEATAGVAGLIKTIMSMKNGVIPGNLHFNNINPQIDLDKLNLTIASENIIWKNKGDTPRRAMVNSFGFGGTNANVILEEAPKKIVVGIDQKPIVNSSIKLLPISHKTEKGLMEQVKKYALYIDSILESGGDVKASFLHNICYSASVRREHHKYRVVFMASDSLSMLQTINEYLEGHVSQNYVAGSVGNESNTKPCFVFSGMGPQWSEMGLGLYNTEPVFKQAMDKCSVEFEKYSGWSLTKAIFCSADATKINQTNIAQPAIFAIQYSLASLLLSWGLEPGCMVGHSAGEVAAACVAGALSFDDAIKVIFHRSQLQHTTEGLGLMLAVGLSEEALRPYIKDAASKVSIAAINSEQALTLAGDGPFLASLEKTLGDQGFFARMLNVNVPYHSPVMDRLKTPLIQALQGIQVKDPGYPLYSTVTAMATQRGDWGVDYWPKNVRDPVNFQSTIQRIERDGFTNFIEIAPNAALASSIKKTISDGRIVNTLKRQTDDDLMLQHTLANIHVNGIGLDWKKLYPNGGEFVELPNYAWQHESYWVELEDQKLSRLRNLQAKNGFSEPVHPLLGSALKSTVPIWQKSLDLSDISYLEGHLVGEDIIYPGAAYVEAGLSVAYFHCGQKDITLENITFSRPFFLSEENTQIIETRLNDGLSFHISVEDTNTGEWNVYSSGTISEIARPKSTEKIDIQSIISSLPKTMNRSEFYSHCHSLGLNYRGYFQLVEQAWYSFGEEHDESLIEIKFPEQLISEANENYLLHPVMLDGVFQGLFPTVDRSYLPVKISKIHYYDRPKNHTYAHIITRYKSDFDVIGDIKIFDDLGEVCVEIIGVELKARVNAENNVYDSEDISYEFQWELRERTLAKIDENATAEWIILSGKSELSEKIAQQLEKYSIVSRQVNVDLECVDYDQLVEIFESSNNTCVGILYLLGLDALPIGEVNDDQVLEECSVTTIFPMKIVQAINRIQWKNAIDLCFVTRSAHIIVDTAAVPDPIQGALWGFARVLASEHSEYNVSLVDLASDYSHGAVESLAQEILCDDFEQECAFREGRRYVNRLQKLNSNSLISYADRLIQVSADSDFSWGFGSSEEPYEINNLLSLRRVSFGVIDENQIEIEVSFSESISRELERIHNVGFGISGRIVNIGSNVKHLALGESVVAYCPHNLSSKIRLNKNAVVRIPKNLDTRELTVAAGSAAVAWYALEILARLRAGETLLIHDAYEGFGRSAIRHALRRKVIVFATVKNKQQRDTLLRDGVAGVYLSSDFNFVEDLGQDLIAMGKSKISVAINTRPGQYLHKTISMLDDFGRLIDLSKSKIEAFGEKSLSSNLSFHVFDPTKLGVVIPECFAEITKDSLINADVGRNIKIVEHSFYDFSSAETSFDNGSIFELPLLNYTKPKPRNKLYALQGTNNAVIKSDGTYLVTGGLGGLGLIILDWLVELGAVSIALCGRRQADEIALKKIQSAQARGVDVRVVNGDISDTDSTKKVLEYIDHNMQPLAGVIHSAGVLSDGVIAQQTEDKFRRVMLPKIKGAWNLHVLTKSLDLSCFICFSSIASMVGWSGQSNYSAANAFLDTLAHLRRAEGLVALTINWGPWAEAGMAANLDDRDVNRMKDAGMTPLSAEKALSAQLSALRYGLPQVGVFELDWSLILKAYSRPSSKTVLESFVNRYVTEASEDFYEKLMASSNDIRENMLVDKISKLLAKLLGMPSSDEIDISASVYDYGLDSLMALNFANHLQGLLGSKMSSTVVMKYPSVAMLAAYILSNLNQQSDEGQDLLMWSESEPNEMLTSQLEGDLAVTQIVNSTFQEGVKGRWNLSALLDIDSSEFNLNAIKTALKILVSYHDGVRVQVCQEKSGLVRQKITLLEGDVRVDEYDFSDESYEQGLKNLESIDYEIQESFSYDDFSPLYRFAYIKLNDSSPHRLYVLFSHYIADGISLQILSQHMSRIYPLVLNSKPVYLPKKEHSLIDWNNAITAYANSTAEKEMEYWESLGMLAAKKAYVGSDKRFGRTQDVKFSKAETKNTVVEGLSLLANGSDVDVVDVVLESLVKAFCQLTGKSKLWLNMVHSGRSISFDGIESVDCFGQVSYLGSALLDASEFDDIGENLRALKKQRVEAPSQGIGLNLLKFINSNIELSSRIKKISYPRIKFNYMPDFKSSFEFGNGISFARERLGPSMTQEPDCPFYDFYIAIYPKDGCFFGDIISYTDEFGPDVSKFLSKKITDRLDELNKYNHSKEKLGGILDDVNV